MILISNLKSFIWYLICLNVYHKDLTLLQQVFSKEAISFLIYLLADKANSVLSILLHIQHSLLLELFETKLQKGENEYKTLHHTPLITFFSDLKFFDIIIGALSFLSWFALVSV